VFFRVQARPWAALGARPPASGEQCDWISPHDARIAISSGVATWSAEATEPQGDCLASPLEIRGHGVAEGACAEPNLLVPLGLRPLWALL